MAVPTRTQNLNDKVIKAIDTYLATKPADVIFEPSLLLQSIFRAARMPGTPNGEKPLFAAPPGNVVKRNGREVWIPVSVQRSTNTQAFTGADELSVNIDPVMSVQRFHFANYTDMAGLLWEEAQEGMGPQGIIDLMQARSDMVFRTLSEVIEGDLWSTNDGVSTNPKEILGIQHLLSNDPTTGTVWNINRATYTWQRHNASDANGAFSSVGLAKMRAMYALVSGSGGFDPPSAIFTTAAVFNAFTAVAEGIQQITRGGKAELGFEMATYRGIPITYSDNCPAGKQFWTNMKYFYAVVPNGSAFQPKRYMSPPNQAVDILWRLFFRAQWGISRYDRQGVIYGFTDT